MSKAVIVGAVVVGALVLAKRHALSRDGFVALDHDEPTTTA